jgi:hypothetical protein
MGAKHPDNIRMPPSPEQGLTLAEMHVREWVLKASCRRCGVCLQVSLPATKSAGLNSPGP